MKTFSRILSLLMAMAVLLSAVTGALSVSAADGDLVISDCDTLDGWVKTGGNKLDPRADNAYNSAYGLRCDVSYGKFATATYTTETPLDISNHTYVEWDMRFVKTTDRGLGGTLWEQIVSQYGTTGNNTMFLRLISESGYRVYFLSKLETTVSTTNSEWVHFRATISNNNSENGTFDPSALTGFYFTTADTHKTTVDDGVIAIDNIKATGYAEPQKTPVAITECEDTTGWTYAGKVTLGNSAAGKTGSALILEGGYGILRKLTYTAATPIDVTDYKAIEWDMTALAVGVLTDQFESVAETYTDTIGVEISDGTTTAVFGLLDLEITNANNGWWHLAVSLENSGLDLSNIVSFTIYTREAEGVTTTEHVNTIYKLDNIYATDATVTPNGYEYAALKDMLLEDAEDLTGWTYYDQTTNTNMKSNTNGYTGSAVEIYGGYCKIGPVKYTFANPVNISRHGLLSWNIRFLKAGAADDLLPVALEAYKEHAKVTVADSKGNSYAYGLSDIKVEAAAKEGWYTMSVKLGNAANVDFTALSSFTFQLTDGNFVGTDISNCNMRIDNLTAAPAAPLEMGDVNGDGYTDARDVVRFKKYEAGNELEFFTEVADINADGEVTMQDVVALRELLLGNEIEISQYTLLNNNGWSEVVKPA